MKLRLAILLAFACSLFGQGTVPPINTWVKPAVGGYPASVVGYDKAQWCAGLAEVCIAGDYHGSHSEKNETLIGYSYSTNRWHPHETQGVFHTENAPDGGHSVGLFSYDTDTGCVLYGFGASGSNEYEHPFHLFCYNDVGLTGRDLFPAPRFKGFGTTPLESMSYNQTAKLTVIFPDSNGKVSVYDAVTNTISEPATTGPSPCAIPAGGCLVNHSTVYNDLDGKTYVFGGSNSGAACSGSLYDDIYSFDAVANVWTHVTTISPPPGRMWAGFAFSKVDNKFLVFGGTVCVASANAFINELWQLDPAAGFQWTQLTPSGAVSVPFGDSADPFEKFVYDPVDNIFILVVTGNGTTDYAGPGGIGFQSFGLLPAAVYVFALSTPLGYGRVTTPFTPPAGSLNVTAPTSSVQSDAMEPDLFTFGATLYREQVETGTPFLTTSDTYRHTSVQSTHDGITWAPLGTGYAAQDPENFGALESEKPRLAWGGSSPCETHTKWSANGVVPSVIFAKCWNGSAWIGGPIGLIHASSPVWQSHNAAIAVGSTFYIPFIEVDNSVLGATTPNNNFVYIVHQVGSSWVQDGGSGITGALNRIAYNSSTTFSRAENIASATNGAALFIGWTETGEDNDASGSVNTTTQVFVDQLVAGTVTTLGGSLNQNAGSVADGIGMMYFSGVLYVTWTEHTAAGVAKVFVASWSGSAWSLVGSGAVNIDATNGWGFRPRLLNDGVLPYVAWAEQTLGGFAHLYVDVLSGGVWTNTGGGALNMSGSGSVSGITATTFLSKPTMAWTEATIGNLKQVYSKWFYNGHWNVLGTIAPVIGLTALPSGQVNTPYSRNLAVTGTPSANCTVTSGTLPTGLSLSLPGVISGTPTTFVTSSFTVTCTNTALPNGQQAYSLAINIATAPLIVGLIQ